MASPLATPKGLSGSRSVALASPLSPELLDLTSERIRIGRKPHLVDQHRVAPVVPAEKFLQQGDGLLGIPLHFGIEPGDALTALLDVSLPSLVNLSAGVVHFMPFRKVQENREFVGGVGDAVRVPAIHRVVDVERENVLVVGDVELARHVRIRS